MTTDLTDEQIVQHLKQKEVSLLSQLEKVRAALSAYDIGNYTINGIVDLPLYQQGGRSTVEFDEFMSYDQKVIFALRGIQSGYINHMVDFLIGAGDTTPKDRLYSGLTGAASRLYRKSILKADTRGKKYKYHFNPDTEQERAEILPL